MQIVSCHALLSTAPITDLAEMLRPRRRRIASTVGEGYAKGSRYSRRL